MEKGMKVSHLLYKANNLQDSFNKFRELGFKVEYGTKKAPHNALVYFSQGPYIELLEKAPVSRFIKILLRLIGKGKVVDRFDSWEAANEGFFEICLENYCQDFKEEEKILQKFGIKYFLTKSRRQDPSGRVLKWSLLFPYELRLPFLMTYFNVDPKPPNYTHPNGIKRIKHISYGTSPKLMPVLTALCDDNVIDFCIGTGIKDIIYEL